MLSPSLALFSVAVLSLGSLPACTSATSAPSGHPLPHLRSWGDADLRSVFPGLVPRRRDARVALGPRVPHPLAQGNGVFDPFGLLDPTPGVPASPADSVLSEPADLDNPSKHSSSSSTGTTSGTTKHTTTTLSFSQTNTNSIIGTPGPVPTAIPTSTEPTTPSTSEDGASSTSSPTPTQTDTSSASSTPSKWKIIGLGVISFVGVATIILAVVFWDTLAAFLAPALALCFPRLRSRASMTEQLIPDWRRRSWRIGIEGTDDRYPSVASFPSILEKLGEMRAAGAGVDEKGALGERERERERMYDLVRHSPFDDIKSPASWHTNPPMYDAKPAMPLTPPMAKTAALERQLSAKTTASNIKQRQTEFRQSLSAPHLFIPSSYSGLLNSNEDAYGGFAV